MRFTDGFRLAELVHGGQSTRAALSDSLRAALESSEPEQRAAWLTRVTTELRELPRDADPRVMAIVGHDSSFAPRRRYRPPPGFRAHLIRMLRAEPTSTRAAREIAELEGGWD